MTMTAQYRHCTGVLGRPGYIPILWLVLTQDEARAIIPLRRKCSSRVLACGWVACPRYSVYLALNGAQSLFCDNREDFYPACRPRHPTEQVHAPESLLVGRSLLF